MKPVLVVFRAVHAAIALLFGLAALVLVFFAAHEGWLALSGEWGPVAAQSIIEAIGLLAVAVVGLQIANTILEEEVIREANISAPTRARRFVSRFFVVIIVALAIEGLVATFKAIHEDLTYLGYAASMIAATGVLLAAWGVFVRLNRAAEELEPEAMEDAKREDRKIDK